jgi:hypothetical protein
VVATSREGVPLVWVVLSRVGCFASPSGTVMLVAPIRVGVPVVQVVSSRVGGWVIPPTRTMTVVSSR